LWYKINISTKLLTYKAIISARAIQSIKATPHFLLLVASLVVLTGAAVLDELVVPVGLVDVDPVAIVDVDTDPDEIVDVDPVDASAVLVVTVPLETAELADVVTDVEVEVTGVHE